MESRSRGGNRIAYVILTCEKYVDTRVPWQRRTMLRNVAEEDVYYLAHTMDPAHRLFSWGADDSYQGLPYKYMDFFRNATAAAATATATAVLDPAAYDWVVLLDDDTYVFTDRLVAALRPYLPSLPVAMGYLLDHIAHTEWGVYFSGGAGTVLSRAAFTLLVAYVQQRTTEELVPHWCADICIGRWLRRHPEIQQVHHRQFHPENAASAPQDQGEAITYHHLKTWEEYAALAALCAENP